MANLRVSIEGLTPDEILSLSDAERADLVPLGQPVVFSAGSAEILGEVREDGDRLVVQLAHIDGGGEGVLPTITVLCQRYARLRAFGSIEWIVNAVHCARPNLKLRRVLERRGYTIETMPDRGEVYRLVEPAN
jgi:hypothetical protein